MTDKKYTIDIPGMHDIIRIPAIDNKDTYRKRQRLIKWHTRNSPVPRPVQEVVSVATTIDNAEDIITSALLIGRWLAPNLLRVIPGVGWIITGIQLAGWLNSILYAPSTGIGGVTKAETRQALRSIALNAAGRRALTENFLTKHFPPLAAALVIGQASQSITGYGIAIGSVFGALSDSLWSLIRDPSGANTVVRFPHDRDMKEKAAYWAWHRAHRKNGNPAYTKTEHRKIIAADTIAINVLIEELSDPIKYANFQGVLDVRMPLMLDMPTPTEQLWREDTRQAMVDLGYDPDTQTPTTLRSYVLLPNYIQVYDPATGYYVNQPDGTFRKYYRDLPPGTTTWYGYDVGWEPLPFSASLQDMIADYESYKQDNRDAEKWNDNGTVMQAVHAANIDNMWSFLNDAPATWEQLPPYKEFLEKCLEFGVWPAHKVTTSKFVRAARSAVNNMSYHGLTALDQNACIAGWVHVGVPVILGKQPIY